MKKLFSILLMSVLFIGITTSCGKSPLEREIEAANKDMPMNIAPGIEASKVFIEGNNVIFLYNVEGETLGIDEDMADLWIKTIKEEMLSSTDSDIKKMAELCVNEGKGIIFRYHMIDSGKDYDVELTSSELKSIL